MGEVMVFTRHSQVASSVRHVLGFTPTESMVFIGVTEDNRLNSVVRTNLDPVPTANEILQRVGMRSPTETAFLLVVYSTDHSLDSILAEWAEPMSVLPLASPLLFVQGPIVFCQCGGCLPETITDDTVDAMYAYLGSVPAESREARAALLDARPVPPDCFVDVDVATAEQWRRVLDTVDPRDAPSDRDLAGLVVSLADSEFRARVGASLDGAPLWLLIDLAARCQGSPLAAEMLQVVAVGFMYRTDGFMASQCLDRAAAVAPYHPVTHLLRMLVARGLTPDQVRAIHSGLDPV
jgi:hypothetical protein